MMGLILSRCIARRAVVYRLNDSLHCALIPVCFSPSKHINNYFSKVPNFPTSTARSLFFKRQHEIYTRPVDWISHREWRETREQLIRLPELALLGCCLVSLLFLCNILSTGPVQLCNQRLLKCSCIKVPDCVLGWKERREGGGQGVSWIDVLSVAKKGAEKRRKKKREEI